MSRAHHLCRCTLDRPYVASGACLSHGSGGSIVSLTPLQVQPEDGVRRRDIGTLPPQVAGGRQCRCPAATYLSSTGSCTGMLPERCRTHVCIRNAHFTGQAPWGPLTVVKYPLRQARPSGGGPRNPTTSLPREPAANSAAAHLSFRLRSIAECALLAFAVHTPPARRYCRPTPRVRTALFLADSCALDKLFGRNRRPLPLGPRRGVALSTFRHVHDNVSVHTNATSLRRNRYAYAPVLICQRSITDTASARTQHMSLSSADCSTAMAAPFCLPLVLEACIGSDRDRPAPASCRDACKPRRSYTHACL